MASNDQWPPVSHASAGKGSTKINGNKRYIKESQQETLKKLNEMFVSTLEPAVILSVVQNCNWELQPSIEGLITLSETVDNPLIRNETVVKTRNNVPKVSANRDEQRKTESTKIVENDRTSKPPENSIAETPNNPSRPITKVDKSKRSGTKNRMGSFCGNIAKLKSSGDNNKAHESQGLSNKIDDKSAARNSREFEPFFEGSCVYGATGPACIEKGAKPVSHAAFPDDPNSPERAPTRGPTSEKKINTGSKKMVKKNIDKQAESLPTEETKDWPNKNRMIATFDGKMNAKKNESESLCGLKVQYRFGGMESSSDDDADVVVEDESSDYKINLASAMATSVSQFLSPATQTPPQRTKPEIHMISTPSPPRTPQRSIYDATLARIKSTIKRGDKILIILRGLPGSGKSTLAKSIVKTTIGGDSSAHVYSTDDYFVDLGRGVYKFDPTKLSDAHSANQTRVSRVMKQGRTPIVVDNTNIAAWEMRPYAAMAVQNGYIVEIIEPNTPWSRNPKELAEKNTHNIPKSKIVERASRFETITSGRRLLEIYGLKYPSWNKPQPYTTEPSSLSVERKRKEIDPCIDDIKSNWENDEKNNYILSSHDIESMQNIDETHNAQSKDESHIVRDDSDESNVENCPEEIINYADKVFGDYLQELQDSDDESFEMIDDPPNEKFTDIKKSIDVDATSGVQCNVEALRNALTENNDDSQGKDTSSNGSQPALGAIGSERKINNSASINNLETEKEGIDNKGNGLSQCWDFTMILEGYKLHSSHGHYVSPFAIHRNEIVEEVCDNIDDFLDDFPEKMEKKFVIPRPKIIGEKASSSDKIEVENVVDSEKLKIEASKEENIVEETLDNNYELINNGDSAAEENSVRKDTKYEIMDNPVESPIPRVEDRHLDIVDDVEKGSSNSDTEIDKGSGSESNENDESSISETFDSLLNSTKTSFLTGLDESLTIDRKMAINEGDEFMSLVDDASEDDSEGIAATDTLVKSIKSKHENSSDDNLINLNEENSMMTKNEGDLIDFDCTDSPKIENLAETIAESVTSAGIIEFHDKIADNYKTFGDPSVNSNEETRRSRSDKDNEGTTSLLTDNINSISWKESPFPVDDIKIPLLPIVGDKKIIPKSDAGTMTTFYDFNVAYVGGTSEPGYRELWGVSRSINEGITNIEAIDKEPSKKQMFDKSSMTGETNILANETNENLEKEKDSTNRLDDLIEMFPHYPREYLKTLYEQQCNCNFDWVVDVLLLADVPNLTIENYEKIRASSGENNDDSIVDTVKLWKIENEKLMQRSHSSSPRNRRNRNKDFRSFSLDSASDRNCTNCEISFSIDDTSKMKDEEEDKILQLFYSTAVTEPSSNVSAVQNDLPEASSSSTASACTTDIANDDNEEIMELNFGRDFINCLENACGNPDFVLPDEFEPVIKIKKSMVEELYGLWIKSMDDQMKVLHAQLDERMAKDEAMARAVDREETEKSSEPIVPNLEEIMNMEMALARYQNGLKENVAKETPNDMASRLTRQMLYELLPDIDQQILSDLLKAHDGNFKETCEIIEANIGRKISNTDTLKKQQSLLERVNEERINQDVQQNFENTRTPIIVVNPDIHTSEKSEVSHYEAAIQRGRSSRMEAQKQFSLRIENYNKAAEAYRKGQPEVAAYYSQMVKLHEEKANAAHSSAADEFLSAQLYAQYGEDTLDLHHLFVREALEALDVFIDYQLKKLNKSNKRSTILFIITGYGARSNNGLGKIKPAVSKKLMSKNIRFTEANPGCLKVTLSRRNGMSD